MKGFLSEERPIRTLREVLQRLRESYCGKIGYEVSMDRHSSVHLLCTLTPFCSISVVSIAQPSYCHWVESCWGTDCDQGLKPASCACSTCTSQTGNAATG